MKTLMYPLGPDDDFPDEFCAIRQSSGEHWFYTPVGEDASWMLFCRGKHPTAYGYKWRYA